MKHFRCNKHRPHYHYHTSKRYEDEKTTSRFAVLGLALGILTGACTAGVIGAIIFGIIGLFGGAFIGWIVSLFN